MRIRLWTGELIEATRVTLINDGGLNTYLVENWDGGIHEYFFVDPSEVNYIQGKDGLKSWD